MEQHWARPHLCVAVYCGVLQHVLQCVEVLQCVAVCCIMSECRAELGTATSVCCIVLQHVAVRDAVCCSMLQGVLQCVAGCCNVSDCRAEMDSITPVCCSMLQCVAAYCRVLQCDAA